MEQSKSPIEAGDGPDSIKRACDQCRIRKIRCDKESPCSNCRTAQRSCSSTGAGQKPKEARQRVLISTQYEKKIDHFEDRLRGIEQMLRELTTSLNSPSHRRPSVHTPTLQESSASFNAALTPSNNGDASSTAFDQDDDLESAFEGDSSLAAHTVFASEFLEHTVGRTPLRQLSPTMQSALSSLQQIVSMQNEKLSSREVRFPNQKSMPKGGLKELPLPPLPVVVKLLREIKAVPPITFTLVCAFMAIDNFTDSCQKVYFATEDFSIATFIVVNAGLYYLFQEKAVTHHDSHPDLAAEYYNYHLICRDNLETALSHLPLLLPAKVEMIEALLLGTSYAMECSRPSIAWQLNSAAAQLCQTLGLHRLGPRPADHSPEEALYDHKSGIFWFTYMLDKGLALRLGRSSVLQDYDILMPYTMRRPVEGDDALREVLTLWIRHAEIQGKSYEQLYSPAAVRRPVADRVAAARLLAEQLRQVARETHELQKAVVSKNLFGDQSSIGAMTSRMVVKSDEVSQYSAMTLVYRAIPPEEGSQSMFNSECISAARAALQSHQECVIVTSPSRFVTAAYIHWTILYAPFIPFIVIFCHIIETSRTDDLPRLADFINSLESTREVSEAIAKLHQLCQVMYKIASLYVEAKSQQQEDEEMAPIGNDFDMYLSQLGLVPGIVNASANANAGVGANTGATSVASSASPVTSGAGIESVQGVDPVLNQGAQLADWFSGNRYVMGLLEEDLSQFHPEVWGSITGPGIS